MPVYAVINRLHIIKGEKPINCKKKHVRKAERY